MVTGVRAMAVWVVALLVLGCVVVGAHPGRVGRPDRSEKVVRGCAVWGRKGHIEFANHGCTDALAEAAFQPGNGTRSGWAQLSVSTASGVSDRDQLEAAGVLEGYLTAFEIYAHWHNVLGTFKISEAQEEWLLEQQQWSEENVRVHGKRSEAWRAVGLTLAQLEGLVRGYQQRRAHEIGLHGQTPLPPLGLLEFLKISAVGDLGDIAKAIAERSQGAVQGYENSSPDEHLLREFEGMTPEQVVAEVARSGHCSAIVRVTPDLSDIFLGHSAWFTFGGMVRIFKHYTFGLADVSLPLRGMSFSSYPGELSSDDDFYLLDTGLAVLQTTNRVFNRSLFAATTPQTLPSWQRERAACWRARAGADWAAALAEHNSGTGNNQWMVVDLGRFVPGQDLPAGLLTVVEQIPGHVAVRDGTAQLVRGYWPSYNIPSDPRVYEASGYRGAQAALRRRGLAWAAAADALSYQRAPRAAIFRRDAASALDLAGMQALMRSNNWPHEPLGGGGAYSALCARGDVDARDPTPYGCYDSKVTTWRGALRRQALAVNGPTSTTDIPPFDWRAVNATISAQNPHILQPDRFDYRFGLVTPDPAAWEDADPGPDPWQAMGEAF